MLGKRLLLVYTPVLQVLGLNFLVGSAAAQSAINPTAPSDNVPKAEYNTSGYLAGGREADEPLDPRELMNSIKVKYVAWN